MKIASVETIALSIPFDTGAPRDAFVGASWRHLDVLLVKVQTEDGTLGWGDAFSYSCLETVRASVQTMVAPRVIGRDASNIGGLMHELQHGLHLFGRYGINMFALSALDIALWDIAAKRAGAPLARLLGGIAREQIPAYASLFRYGDPERVAARCALALEQGYAYVKLHETREPEVRAARETLGEGVPLMVDTNCPWTPEQARLNALRLRPYDLHWLEEPIFPPEDFCALARLQRDVGVPLAAGENACTAHEFKKMFDARAVSYAQPSVTKVGGVTELMRVAALARAGGVALMPHSPYFGPGFLATLQIAAALPEASLIERFHMDTEASLYGPLIDPVVGAFALPGGSGLGAEPDPDVIR
ncbi:MAG: mandelate racemase/muconate lactonizing enzyme family protein, partial [Gammaproteobacteria bacterium]